MTEVLFRIRKMMTRWSKLIIDNVSKHKIVVQNFYKLYKIQFVDFTI